MAVGVAPSTPGRMAPELRAVTGLKPGEGHHPKTDAGVASNVRCRQRKLPDHYPRPADGLTHVPFPVVRRDDQETMLPDLRAAVKDRQNARHGTVSRLSLEAVEPMTGAER